MVQQEKSEDYSKRLAIKPDVHKAIEQEAERRGGAKMYRVGDDILRAGLKSLGISLPASMHSA